MCKYIRMHNDKCEDDNNTMRVYVHEPKTKVDLTRIIETQAFVFDDAFDSHETNELIYARTIKPLVDFVFEGKLLKY